MINFIFSVSSIYVCLTQKLDAWDKANIYDTKPWCYNLDETYSGYFLDTRFRVLLRKISDGITNIRQSKRQRVQVHSSMNTTQKASSTFEAFLVEKNNVLQMSQNSRKSSTK